VYVRFGNRLWPLLCKISLVSLEANKKAFRKVIFRSRVSSLITWFIFAIYFHTRLSKGWNGFKSSLLASFGFIIIWVCYLGVNLMGKGLHSYGFLS
jgi:ABC-type uncharacterized transport system permease subunit